MEFSEHERFKRFVDFRNYLDSDPKATLADFTLFYIETTRAKLVRDEAWDPKAKIIPEDAACARCGQPPAVHVGEASPHPFEPAEEAEPEVECVVEEPPFRREDFRKTEPMPTPDETRAKYGLPPLDGLEAETECAAALPPGDPLSKGPWVNPVVLEKPEP